MQTRNKVLPILALIVLILSQLACGLDNTGKKVSETGNGSSATSTQVIVEGKENPLKHGYTRIILEADIPATQQVTDADMNAAVTIIEDRIKGLGVTDAMVVRAGGRQIVVELPVVKDPEQVIATIKQTSLLEFVDMSSITQAEAVSLKDAGSSIVTDYSPTGVISPIQPISSTQQVWHTVMTGADLKTAVVSVQTGKYEVSFELTSAGASTFKDFTSSHIGQVLAIVLDKKIISAPTINDTIPDGKGVISGNFTPDTANQLAIQLRYGALPIPLKIVEMSTVTPTP